MRKLKAPHYDIRKKDDPHSTLVIIAGADSDEAWGAWKTYKDPTLNKIIMGNYCEGDFPPDYKPIILDEQQLKALPNTLIATDKHEVFDIYQAGTITQEQQYLLEKCLAETTNVKLARLFSLPNLLSKNITPTDLMPSISRIRNDNALSEVVAHNALEKQKQADYPAYFAKLNRLEKTEDILLKSPPMAISRDSELFSYDKTTGIWAEITDEAESVIYNFLRSHGIELPNLNKQKELASLLIKEIRYKAEKEHNHAYIMNEPNSDVLCFRNGVLDKTTGKLLPFNPNLNLRSRLDININEIQSTPTTFLNWLNFIAEDNEERRTLLLSVLYVVLVNRYDWQMFFELTGRGGTGKTTFLKVCELLAGKDNHTAINLIDLDKNAHATASIVGKSLLTAEDQPVYNGDGSTVRAITGKGTITVNPKYKKPFSYEPKAVLLIANNAPMRFKENNGGIERRRVLITFEKAVERSQRDSTLIDKIASELSDIVRYLLTIFNGVDNEQKAYSSLLKQQDNPQIKQILNSLNPIRLFAEEFTTTDEVKGLKISVRGCGGGNIPSRQQAQEALYPAYLFFCDRHGLNKPLSRQSFLNEVDNAFKLQGKQPIKVRKIDNTQRTNVYYSNIEDTFLKWDD